ncbi:MAG: hypothetical protein JST09_02670 [Bacteroidetes bacterium]|nr:hypothetical protein [Bacteroidota bacterium]
MSPPVYINKAHGSIMRSRFHRLRSNKKRYAENWELNYRVFSLTHTWTMK